MECFKAYGKPVRKLGCSNCGETTHRYEGREQEKHKHPHLWTCLRCGTSKHLEIGPKITIPFVEKPHEKSDVYQDGKVGSFGRVIV